MMFPHFLSWLPLWILCLSLSHNLVLGAPTHVKDELATYSPPHRLLKHRHSHIYRRHPLPQTPAQTKRTVTTHVFSHYMVGTLTDAHAQQDIQTAVSIGLDAFALNIADVTSSWAINTCQYLFKYAQANNFKLFFSFDMSSFRDPNQFTSFLQGYINHPAYFKYSGTPLVSSYLGGTLGNNIWQQNLKNVMSNYGTPVLFMPAWPDIQASSDFFSRYPVCDGVMNWDSWPFQSDGAVNVSISTDLTYQQAAKSAGKKFIMGASPLQFKHIDSSSNYYRRGKGNFDNRVGQMLGVTPDMVELQTWNDVGESHNMGLAWPEGITCCANIQAYSTDHSAFLEIMPTLIKGIKSSMINAGASMVPSNGKTIQGIFYYHKLLASADCSGDSLGKPSGANLVEDVVTSMIYLTTAARGWRAITISNGKVISNVNLNPGYNNVEATGVQAGSVQVNVVDGSGTVKFTGTGPNPVLASSSLCNYNIEVAKLASVS